jgi:hypothetical protein
MGLAIRLNYRFNMSVHVKLVIIENSMRLSLGKSFKIASL